MKTLTILALTLFALPAFARIDAFPSLLRFQDTPVGRRSFPQQVTITNRGLDDIQSLQVFDACVGSFDVQPGSCLGPLRANQSCYVMIAFTPRREGPQSCSITISSGSAQEFVDVSGRGTPRRVFGETTEDPDAN